MENSRKGESSTQARSLAVQKTNITAWNDFERPHLKHACDSAPSKIDAQAKLLCVVQ